MGEIDNVMLEIARQGVFLVVLLSGIPIILSMVVGILISVLQAATQIQEQTLTFVPKMIVVFGTLIVAGYWMIGQLVRFTHGLFLLIPQVTQGTVG